MLELMMVAKIMLACVSLLLSIVLDPLLTQRCLHGNDHHVDGKVCLEIEDSVLVDVNAHPVVVYAVLQR